MKSEVILIRSRYLGVQFGVKAVPIRSAESTKSFGFDHFGSNLGEAEDHARRHIAIFESVEDLVDGR